MYVERDNESVKLAIETELESCQPVFNFHWECGDQEYAQLLVNQINKVLGKRLREMAKRNYERGWRDAKSKKRKGASGHFVEEDFS